MGNPERPRLRSRVIDRSPIFYGWIVLAAGTFGIMATLPGQTVGVSVFLDEIIRDLGLSRSLVSTLYLVGTLAGSFVLPFVGRFIDRRGPRLTVVVVAAAFALACVWMGTVQGVVMLLIGFTLIRALGQGSRSRSRSCRSAPGSTAAIRSASARSPTARRHRPRVSRPPPMNRATRPKPRGAR
jgi:MFS family permease